MRNSNVNFLGTFIKPKRFNDTIDGVTIYTENKDVKGYLYNLYIKKEIDNGFEITYAKKGIFKRSDDIPILVLFNGETIRNKNNKITNFSFSKSDFLLKDLKANTITQQKNQEMTTKDVLSCLMHLNNFNSQLIKKSKSEINNCRNENKINLSKEAYKRLVTPLYIPILMLVPYFLIFSSKERIHYSKLKFATFIFGIFIIIFSEGVIRFISKDLNNNIIIFIFPFIILFSVYLMFFAKFYFRLMKK